MATTSTSSITKAALLRLAEQNERTAERAIPTAAALAIAFGGSSVEARGAFSQVDQARAQARRLRWLASLHYSTRCSILRRGA